MSEINENLEVNETVENSTVESAPQVEEVTEATPVVEEVAPLVEEVATVVEEPVVEEIAPVTEEVAVVAEEVAPVAEEVAVVAEKPAKKEKKVAVEKPVLVETVLATTNEEEFDWDAFEGKKPTAGSTSKQSMTEILATNLTVLFLSTNSVTTRA
ncbi:MAG: hypothetical protein NTZ69_12915 [Bacteroidia bacterium]|nr:hypothetical protein [Bacteroidia bacterium]